jgi:dienelactone hydrolase
MEVPQISDYQKSSFTAPISDKHEVTHNVYEKGEGPVVVIIQELPGIGQETLRLAQYFLQDGFKVVLPHLFGPLGKTSTRGNLVRVMCMRKEFHLLATNRSSPVVNWLKALCRDLKVKNKVKGVGTIGMCLTGNFAISLMADDSVLAGVASQPSLPFQTGSKVPMSREEIEQVKVQLDQHGPMKAFRFEKDPICSAARFEAINKALNTDGQERIQLETLPGKGHSVLTLHFHDEEGHPTRKALDQVLAYFGDKLK